MQKLSYEVYRMESKEVDIKTNLNSYQTQKKV